MLARSPLTFVVPFELLLLSYVVLGPAHYVTEISWLHDRKYFLPHRGVAHVSGHRRRRRGLIDQRVLVRLRDVGRFCGVRHAGGDHDRAAGMLVFIAAIALTAIMLSNGLSLAVLGILLPTLIHVSLFTLVFMTLGAYRSGARVQWLLVALYVGAIATILIAPPSAATLVPAFAKAAHEYFANRGAGARALPGDPEFAARHPADEPARFHLHLSLPELVHQSRGDPLEQHAPSAGSRSLRRRAPLRPRSISTITVSVSRCCWPSAWRISCWNFRSMRWRCGSSAPPSGRARARPFRAHSPGVSHVLFPWGHFRLLSCSRLWNGSCSAGAGEGARHTECCYPRELLLTPCQIVTSPRLRAAAAVPDSGFTFKQLCPC